MKDCRPRWKCSEWFKMDSVMRPEFNEIGGTSHERFALSFLVVATLILGSACHSIPQTEPDASGGLKEHLERYVGLFNAADTEAIARSIYAAPVMVVSPETGEHLVRETPGEVEQAFSDTIKKIRAKGWARSVVHDLEFRWAGPDMAVATMLFSRRQANGKAIPPARRLGHYVCLRTDEGWRIILASGQPEPGGAPSPTPETATRLSELMGQYIGYLNGDTPAKDVTERIWQTPRISRSFMGARTHASVMTQEVAFEKLDGYLKQFKAEGLERFIVEDLEVSMAGRNLAFVDLFSERLREDGSAISPGRTGFTYVWMKKSEGWRMIATLAHGALDDPNPSR